MAEQEVIHTVKTKMGFMDWFAIIAFLAVAGTIGIYYARPDWYAAITAPRAPAAVPTSAPLATPAATPIQGPQSAPIAAPQPAQRATAAPVQPVESGADGAGVKVLPTTPVDAPLVTESNEGAYLTDHAPPPPGFAPTAEPLDPATLPAEAPQPAAGQCLHGQVFIVGKGCRNPVQSSGSEGAHTNTRSAP